MKNLSSMKDFEKDMSKKFKTGDKSKRDKIKEYVYSLDMLTENQKDQVWSHIMWLAMK